MKRNLFIDFIKALAIILVVVGHCLQYTSAGDYFQNPVFIVIYSFHMPLFMAISGYLFYKSVHKRSFINIAEIKFKQLVIPLLVWTAFILPLFDEATVKQGLSSSIMLYLHQLPRILWFPWCLFVISVLAAGIIKLFTDAIWVHLVIIVLLLCAPDNYAFFYVKYMYLFFIAGYALNKVNLPVRAITLIAVLSIITYLVLLPYWQESVYVYVSDMKLRSRYFKHDLSIIGYRYLIGLLGVLGFSFLAKQLFSFFHPPIMQKIGQHTLGIYLISSFLMEILNLFVFPQMPPVLYIFFILFLSAMIIAICLVIIYLLEKSKWLNRLLLGANSNLNT